VQAGIPRSSQRLLAFLAIRGGVTGRTAVAATAWPDATETHAPLNLRSALARLERTYRKRLQAGTLELGLAESVTVDIHRARRRGGLTGLRGIIAALVTALLLAGCILPPEPEPGPGSGSGPGQVEATTPPGGLGAARVTSSGAYTRDVAIDVPSFRGIAPDLSLHYDSRLGDGPLGVGWQLAGLSSVVREAPGRGAPGFGASDVFRLDGRELMRCLSGMDAPSCKYPEDVQDQSFVGRADDGRRIRFDPQPGPDGGWTVWSTTGVRSTYMARPHAPWAKATAWDLASVVDPSGNRVTYSYRQEPLSASGQGASHLSVIAYGGVKIRMRYENRPDVLLTADGEGLVRSGQRLASIDVTLSGVRVRAYELAYRQAEGSGRTLLTSVRQYGDDATLDRAGRVTNEDVSPGLPATSFGYRGAPGSGWGLREAENASWGLPFDGGPPLTVMNGVAYTVQEPFDRLTEGNRGDVDANGRSDWVQASPDRGGGRVLITAALAGKRPPIYVQTELLLPFARWIKTQFTTDVDGDGRDDLVFLITYRPIPGPGEADHGGYFIDLLVARSLGDGRFAWTTPAPAPVPTAWESREHSLNRQAHCAAGDVSGDRLGDVVCSFTDAAGNHFLGTARSDGQGGFTLVSEPTGFAVNGETRLMTLGDSNGDGLSDPMFLDFPDCPAADPGCTVKYQLVTALSTGTGYDLERVPTDWDRSGSPPLFFAADIDADHRSDYVVSLPTPDGVEGRLVTAVRRPDGAMVFASQTIPLPLKDVDNSISVGDADGDGAADLLVVSRQPPGVAGCSASINRTHLNLHRVLSRGNGTFALPQSWTGCAGTRELDVPWDSALFVPVDPQAVDLNGDGADDFLIAVSPPGSDVTTLREDLSPNPTRNSADWRSADVDGDGRHDWVYLLNTPTGPLIQTLFSTGSSYRSVAASPAPGTGNRCTARADWRIGDVDADGRDDLICLHYQQPGQGLGIDVWLSNGDGSWQDVASSALTTLSEQQRGTVDWAVADVDGDGRIDLVEPGRDDAGTPVVRALLATGQGTWQEQVTAGASGWPDLGQRGWLLADLNGDGRADLARVGGESGVARLESMLSVPGGWQVLGPQDLPQLPRVTARDRNLWFAAEVNGDGQADLVHLTSVSRRPTEPSAIRVSTLLGHGDGRMTLLPDETTVGSFQGRIGGWRSVGTDPSELTEFAQVQVGPPSIAVSTLRRRAGTWTLVPADSAISQTTRTSTGVDFAVSDVDGDGSPDLTRFDLLGRVGMRVVTMLRNPVHDVIRSVHLPTGGDETIDYTAWTSDVRSTNLCHLPVGYSSLVVSRLSLGSGRGTGNGSESFDYGCPQWSRRDRIPLGWRDVFAARGATPGSPASTLYDRYEQDETCGSRVGYTEVLSASRTGRGKVVTAYLDPGRAPSRCAVNYIDRISVGPSAATDPSAALNAFTYFRYDEFGNVIDVFEYGPDSDGPSGRTTIAVYRPATGPYIVSLPYQIALVKGVRTNGAPVRAVYLCYDGDNGTAQNPCDGIITRGQLTARKLLNPNGWYDTTTFERSPAGELTSITGPNGFTTTISYDTTYPRFPTSVCNPFLQCRTISWNFGLEQPTAENAIDGTRSEIDYDRYGRPRQLRRTGRSPVTINYLATGDPVRQRVRITAGDGTADGLWAETWSDGLGRPWRSVEEAAGQQPAVSDLTYTGAGDLVHTASHPYLDGAQVPVHERFAYDELGRPTGVTHADASRVELRYDADTQHTSIAAVDETGRSTTSLSDVFGRVTTRREPSASGPADTRYTYDVADALTAIFEPGTTTPTVNVEPDSRGDVRAVADQDQGRWTYDYDREGNARLQVDGKGRWTTRTYDAIGRPSTLQTPSGREVTWLYDDPGHGPARGKLTTVLDTREPKCPLRPGFGGRVVDERFYDQAGRLQRTFRCVDGQQVQFSYSYDGLDRLKTLTYPDGETVTYSYDQSGRPNTLSGYVNDVQYDAAGRPTSIVLANGTTNTITYDPSRDWTRRIEVANAAGTVLDATYTHLPDGLVDSVSSSTTPENRTYTYDDAGQLTDVMGDFEQHLTYDPTGNITSNSRLGTYDYTGSCGGGAISCPHAVKKAGNRTYTYDATGNLTAVNDPGAAADQLASITWNADDEPVQFTQAGGATATVSYRYSGQRGTRSSGDVTSRYFGPLAESTQQGTAEPIGTQTYYLGDVAVATRSSGMKHFLHVDDQGSNRLVTTASGAVERRTDFTPFGESTGPPGTPVTDIGYTGHRSADGGLVYMGARYYLPDLGRFASPDPVIPGGLPPRASNRYAYAGNDPIGNVDPTGLDDADTGIGKSIDRGTSWTWGAGAGHLIVPTITVTPPADYSSLSTTASDLPSEAQLSQFSRAGMFSDSRCPICHRLAPGEPIRELTRLEKIAIGSMPFVMLGAAGGAALGTATGGAAAGAAGSWTMVDTASTWLFLRAPRLFMMLLGIGNAMVGTPSQRPATPTRMRMDYQIWKGAELIKEGTIYSGPGGVWGHAEVRFAQEFMGELGPEHDVFLNGAYNMCGHGECRNMLNSMSIMDGPNIFYWGYSFESQPMLQMFLSGIGIVHSGAP
jgi:RHS repeat-associated protein